MPEQEKIDEMAADDVRLEMDGLRSEIEWLRELLRQAHSHIPYDSRAIPEGLYDEIDAAIGSLHVWQQAPAWGYPNHPGVAGPCSFDDGSYWDGFRWVRPPITTPDPE